MSIRSFGMAAALFFAAQGALVTPTFGQPVRETQRLLKIIQEQQRRLDAQEAQLKGQQKALRALHNEVEALQASGQLAAKPPSATPPKAPAGATAVTSYPGLESGKTVATEPQEEWAGSFGLPGSDTRLRISGFAEFNAVRDNNAIQTPTAFVTSAIVTRNATPAEGADGQTNFSVQPSRLKVETRTPLQDHRLSTFVSADFFNDFDSASADIRLRQAYGELTNILFGGDLLAGQTWTTYTNLNALPNTLDFEGPNAVLGLRHPMVRWTKPVGTGLKLKLAAEAPDDRVIEGASSVTRWPDGVVSLAAENHAYNVQGSLVARDLRASGSTSQIASALGWAANFSGSIHMPGALKQDFATFSLTYGEGYGGVLGDAPPDAAYNSTTNELKAIPTWAWYAGYQHWWHPKIYSVVTYGQVRQSNENFQAQTAFRKTQYMSANLTWTPYRQWLFGIEALYGTREDKDGVDGSDFRSQFTSRFNF